MNHLLHSDHQANTQTFKEDSLPEPQNSPLSCAFSLADKTDSSQERNLNIMQAAREAAGWRRILVIGCPGAGKSTFSRKLAALLHLPLVYLDMLFHNPDQTSVSPEQFDQRLQDQMKGRCWIIDGNYLRTLPWRLQQANAVVWLDYPTELCLRSYLGRIGTKRPDMPWVERELDPDFYSYIANYRQTKTPQIEEILLHCCCPILRLQSREQADAFFVLLEQEEMAHEVRHLNDKSDRT